VTAISGRLFWQIALTILVCVVGSVLVAWVLSRGMDFTLNVSMVAALSAVLAAAAIMIELRSKGQH
jgi:hypothetical protein